MMLWPDILTRMGELRRDSEAAKHKPLLLLWVLSRIQAGASNEFPFRDVKAGMESAMSTWAPDSTPFYPFWHLRSDGLWTIDGSDALPRRGRETRPPERVLWDANAVGRLPAEVWTQMMDRPGRVEEAGEHLLRTYWQSAEERQAVRERIGLATSPFAERSLAFPDAAHIKAVDAAAIAAVSTLLRARGFAVHNREKDNCGYDLLGVSDTEALHVEVKGTSRADARFFISANEYRSYQGDPRWRLAMVTSALSGPNIQLLTPDEVDRTFELTPDSWVGRARTGDSRSPIPRSAPQGLRDAGWKQPPAL
jgi:hypothetical protein